MSDTSLARPHSGLAGLVLRVIEGMSAIPYWFTALVLRIPIAAVFWRSGQTKVDGWHLSSSAVDLFRDVAKAKIWPAYKSQYGALWDKIENFKA